MSQSANSFAGETIQMKKLFVLLSAGLLLHSANTNAQTSQIRIDGSLLLKGISATRINQKLHSFQSATAASYSLNKTTSSERVATMSEYDFNQAPGSQRTDTVRLKYSSGRGSAFDFSNLYYNFYNSTEHPNPFIFNSNNLKFDSARNCQNGALMAFRTYNAAGNIKQYMDDTALIQYEYDAANRPTTITQSQYDANSGAWTSHYRDLYYYNAAGQLILDSTELWDGSTGWTHQEKLKYTYDASGRVTFLSVEYDFSNGSVYVIAHQRVDYPGSSTSPSAIVTELTNGHGLDSNYRQIYTYSNNALISYDAYQWAGGWDLVSQERRHLNAANLPDSVFYRYWTSGKATDSTYSKLAYNGQNNPLYRLDCAFTGLTPFGKYSWTYESTAATSVGHLNIEPLQFYPNPASENIHLSGVNGGRYSIFNTAGQLVLAGKIPDNATISIQSLTSGMYLIYVQHTDGKQLQASFIRK
jgi:hypothetical protein